MSFSSSRLRHWRTTFAVAGVAALFLAAAPAQADNVKVDIGTSGPTSLTLSGGTAQTTINYFVQATNSADGLTGCDITSTPSVWTINLPDDVTSSSATISFSDCDVDVPITYTASALMSGADITLTYLSGPTLGQSDAHPGKVSLTVSAGSTDDGNDAAPVVSDDAGNTSGPEGSAQTNSGAFTDADGNSTLTIGWTGAGTVTDNGDGTWSWSYTPVDGPSGGTVSVSASDGKHAAAVDSFDWSASNVAPTVAQPAFSTTSVDCTGSVTLGGISFSDPGLIDYPWHVTIDWGDGSDDTVFDASTQGAQTARTHTYNAVGEWTATVTVSDKDGGITGTGSNTSSNTITVNQTYSVDFLPPFDDSSPSGLIVNKMKNGRVVPVKATIFDDCAGAPVSDPTKTVTIKTSKTSGTGTGDPVEEYADAGQSASNTNQFRWSTDGFWIYNLDSKTLGLVVNNNYRVDIYVGAVKATTDTWAVLQPVK